MPVLRVVEGPLEGQTFKVEDDKITLGRLKRCGIYLPDSTISREHARIFVRGGQIQVADLGSANGTFINDRKITRGELSPGDQLRLGSVPMLFEESVPQDASGKVEAPPPIELESPPEAPPTAKPPPAAKAQPPPQVAADDDDAFEIELPDDDDEAPSSPKPPPPAERKPIKKKPLAPPPPRRPAPHPRPVSQSQAKSSSGGLLGQDLDQQRPAVRILAYSLVLAIAVGLAYAAFTFSRGGTPSDEDPFGDEFSDENEDY